MNPQVIAAAITYAPGLFRFKRNGREPHARFSHKIDVYDEQGTTDHGGGSQTAAGIACVF